MRMTAASATCRERMAKRILSLVNSQLPTSNSQPLPTPNRQQRTELGVGDWEWLGVVSWWLGVDYARSHGASINERSNSFMDAHPSRRIVLIKSALRMAMARATPGPPAAPSAQPYARPIKTARAP